jgi:hypothetical protein
MNSLLMYFCNSHLVEFWFGIREAISPRDSVNRDFSVHRVTLETSGSIGQINPHLICVPCLHSCLGFMALNVEHLCRNLIVLVVRLCKQHHWIDLMSLNIIKQLNPWLVHLQVYYRAQTNFRSHMYLHPCVLHPVAYEAHSPDDGPGGWNMSWEEDEVV